MKLGKKAVKLDDRTLTLSTYIRDKVSLPTPPTTVAPSEVHFGMYANDTIGDCTCAAAANLIRNWHAVEKKKAKSPTTTQVLTLYGKVNGGVDQGAACLDVLNTWRRTGLGKDKIDAYLKLSDHSKHVQLAIWMFGGLYIGVQLPVTAQSAGDWVVMQQDGDGAPGSWGGHCVPVIGYDASWLYVVTWGAVKRMSWTFWTKYVDESYVVLDSVDWVGDVAGLDVAQLKEDLGAL